MPRYCHAGLFSFLTIGLTNISLLLRRHFGWVRVIVCIVGCVILRCCVTISLPFASYHLSRFLCALLDAAKISPVLRRAARFPGYRLFFADGGGQHDAAAAYYAYGFEPRAVLLRRREVPPLPVNIEAR